MVPLGRGCFEHCVVRVSRLFEQSADAVRIGDYVRRWWKWVQSVSSAHRKRATRNGWIVGFAASIGSFAFRCVFAAAERSPRGRRQRRTRAGWWYWRKGLRTCAAGCASAMGQLTFTVYPMESRLARYVGVEELVGCQSEGRVGVVRLVIPDNIGCGCGVKHAQFVVARSEHQRSRKIDHSPHAVHRGSRARRNRNARTGRPK